MTTREERQAAKCAAHLARITKLQTQSATAWDRARGVDAKRDAAIVKAMDDGMTAKPIAAATGLTLARIYQIRDKHRAALAEAAALLAKAAGA